MRSAAPPGIEGVLPVLHSYIETRYGVIVTYAAVPHPFTGDLDGGEIRIQPDLEPDLAVFNLAHLFGHTVQWNTSEASRRIGSEAAPGEFTEEYLERVRAYETEASRYSLEVLHEIGEAELDPWFSDFAGSDLDYLLHFYRTGEKGDFRAFWKSGRPLIQPLLIPPFVPQRSKFRWDGVVI